MLKWYMYLRHVRICVLLKILFQKTPTYRIFFTLGLSKVVFSGDRHGDFVTDSDPPQCSAPGSASYEHKHSVHKAPLYHTLLCEYSTVLVHSSIENFIMIGIQRAYFIWNHFFFPVCPQSQDTDHWKKLDFKR